MESPQEIIRIKRDGGALSEAQIRRFVSGVVDGSFRDYQASALLMAIVLKGMSPEETGWLTEAMLRSGKVYRLAGLKRPKVDKHSTGGVGDKVSIVLAPLAASAGLCVPMMSGRGLGHTGGTLDKLESIPGFSVGLDEAAFEAQLGRIHQAMIGQSEDIVPADRILYALRDVTGTVESIPLISASIMSKKLAEGIDALVLDVKCGSGAFMKTEPEARALAESLVGIARRTGRRASALITRMESPLGLAVGNALEVLECIDCLKGGGPEDLMEVTYALTAEMLRLGGLVEKAAEALPLLREKIASGAALAAFRELVEAQGGDPAVIDDPSGFPSGPSAARAEGRSRRPGDRAGRPRGGRGGPTGWAPDGAAPTSRWTRRWAWYWRKSPATRFRQGSCFAPCTPTTRPASNRPATDSAPPIESVRKPPPPAPLIIDTLDDSWKAYPPFRIQRRRS